MKENLRSEVMKGNFRMSLEKKPLKSTSLKILLFFVLLVGVVFLSPPVLQAKMPVLRVFTYDSFVAKWGPGDKIKKGFEKNCQCKLKYVAFSEAGTLLSRVMLEGDGSKADVILGLDASMIGGKSTRDMFEVHGVELGNVEKSLNWDDPLFVPYDYGYLAFVYDANKLLKVPSSFEELVNEYKNLPIIIEDARSSTTGLGLMLWVKKLYKDKAGEYWKRLSPQILTVSKGWSEAYGLFLKGEAPLVLSYTTSPAYHKIIEGKDNYRALFFNEGNYSQVEVVGILKSSKNKELARKFLKYLLSREVQKILPTTNWMYPVIDLQSELPKEFDISDRLKKTLKIGGKKLSKNKKLWIEEWLEALSK